ncbi:MAG: hypothetical protein R3F37_20920 [Candidatus Competibacteraceae bacterium]
MLAFRKRKSWSAPLDKDRPMLRRWLFRIVGPQLAQLKQYGEELRRIMHTEPAILHTQASIAGGDPKLWFAADEYQARLAGFTLQEIAGQFQTALEGQGEDRCWKIWKNSRYAFVTVTNNGLRWMILVLSNWCPADSESGLIGFRQRRSAI